MRRFDEKEIEVLMLDGCTRTEAEKHLEKGTIIYSDLEERESFREMIRTGAPALDWGVVKKDGKTYYIQYCL